MPKQFGTPGPRAIHPDIATSKSLARCGLLSQLLFDRLICQADDQGRLEDGADYIKAVCVPLIPKATAKAVEAALAELSDEGMILRYSAGGRELLQLLNWWNYQSSMRWSYPSRWPGPPDWSDRVRRQAGDIPPDDGGGIPQPSADIGNLPPDAASSGLAGASAQPRTEPNRTEPNRTEPNRTEPDRTAADALVTYFDLTTRFPNGRVKVWLEELADTHGHGETAKALASEFKADANARTLLSRTQGRLELGAHEENRRAEERRAAKDREAEAKEAARVDAMSEEEKAASKQRWADMKTQLSVIGKPMPGGKAA